MLSHRLLDLSPINPKHCFCFMFHVLFPFDAPRFAIISLIVQSTQRIGPVMLGMRIMDIIASEASFSFSKVWRETKAPS